MAKLEAFFEKWLSGRVDEEKTTPLDINKEISVYVVARVFDGRVAYGSVNVFRKCISAAMRRVNNKRLKVYWFDDYFKKEYKHKREVPLNVREDSRCL